MAGRSQVVFCTSTHLRSAGSDKKQSAVPRRLCMQRRPRRCQQTGRKLESERLRPQTSWTRFPHLKAFCNYSFEILVKHFKAIAETDRIMGVSHLPATCVGLKVLELYHGRPRACECVNLRQRKQSVL